MKRWYKKTSILVPSLSIYPVKPSFSALLVQKSAISGYYYDYVDGLWEDDSKEEDEDAILYPGLSKALEGHMFGLSDVSLDVLVKHQPVALKGTWFGPKNEATYFGKHFGLSCKEMNDAFIFFGKDGKEVKLNYNWNDDNKVDCHSPIYLALERFRRV